MPEETVRNPRPKMRLTNKITVEQRPKWRPCGASSGGQKYCGAGSASHGLVF